MTMGPWKQKQFHDNLHLEKFRMRLKVSGKLKLHTAKKQFLLLLTHLSGPAVFCSKLGGLSDTEHIHPIHLWDKGKRWNQRSAVAAPPLQTRRGTISISGVFAVSYMSTKQLDGCSHLQLPGKAPPLPVIVSVLTGRLQRTAETPCSSWPEPQQSPTEQTTPPVSHSDPWDEVSSLVVVGAGGRSLHGRAHPVFVVLADKDARQFPQRSHVERLKQLALIGLEQKHKR